MPCIGGIDVGLTLLDPSSGICRTGDCGFLVDHAFSDRLSRERAFAMAGASFDILAIDGPVLPPGDINYDERPCEKVFVWSPFQNRCKPGESHAGRTGRALRRGGCDTADQWAPRVLRTRCGAEIPRVHPDKNIVEAFPNGKDTFRPCQPRRLSFALRGHLQASGGRVSRFHVDEGVPTLAVALSELMNAADLKRLAALTKEKLPTRKADLAAVIVRHLEGERLRAVWQGLDELQRAAVAEVVHSRSTRFLADRFRAKYGRDPGWGSADHYGSIRSPSPLCFFFYGNGVMPADLRERLEAFVPPPVEAKVESLEQLPAVYERPFERWSRGTKNKEQGTEPVPLAVREGELSAQRELLSVLRLVDAGKVAVSDKTRRASSAAMDAIAAVLDGGDFYPFEPPEDDGYDENAGPMRAFAWPLLVQAGGLAQLSGSRLQLTKAGRKALVEPAAHTLKTLWEKWTDTTLLDELSRVECVKGQTGKGKHGLTAVSSRRSAIAAALGECPAQRWIAAGELLRFVRASDNDFTVSRNAWNLYIGELQYGSLGYDGAQGILEGRYLLCLLFEYAATLGLVDVAYIPPAGARSDYDRLWGTDDLPFFSRYDGLLFFRITALGAYCLGTSESYERAPVEVKPLLRVLPDMEIAAIGAELEQGDRLALDAYAVRASDFVWRLEAGKLLAATEEGRSVDEIREFLSARSGAPLPDTVARLLDDVGERCSRLQDRGLARLIECAEPALAALVAGDTRTRRHCMRAGERHLVVPASSEAAFRRALREVGYLLAPGTPHGANGRILASGSSRTAS